jgi:hypothetical protein
MSGCERVSRNIRGGERVFDASVLYARSTANGWAGLDGYLMT